MILAAASRAAQTGHLDWTPILVALISAGLLKYLVDFVKWLRARRQAGTSDGRTMTMLTTVDQSLAAVARARDELEADNTTLRAMLQEERASHMHEIADLVNRHNAERAEWTTEKTAMRREIDNLQDRLRQMLDELEDLKRRHA